MLAKLQPLLRSSFSLVQQRLSQIFRSTSDNEKALSRHENEPLQTTRKPGASKKPRTAAMEEVATPNINEIRISKLAQIVDRLQKLFTRKKQAIDVDGKENIIQQAHTPVDERVDSEPDQAVESFIDRIVTMLKAFNRKNEEKKTASVAPENARVPNTTATNPPEAKSTSFFKRLGNTIRGRVRPSQTETVDIELPPPNVNLTDETSDTVQEPVPLLRRLISALMRALRSRQKNPDMDSDATENISPHTTLDIDISEPPKPDIDISEPGRESAFKRIFGTLRKLFSLRRKEESLPEKIEPALENERVQLTDKQDTQRAVSSEIEPASEEKPTLATRAKKLLSPFIGKKIKDTTEDDNAPGAAEPDAVDFDDAVDAIDQAVIAKRRKKKIIMLSVLGFLIILTVAGAILLAIKAMSYSQNARIKELEQRNAILQRENEKIKKQPPAPPVKQASEQAAPKQEKQKERTGTDNTQHTQGTDLDCGITNKDQVREVLKKCIEDFNAANGM